jgi:hypothetical protein
MGSHLRELGAGEPLVISSSLEISDIIYTLLKYYAYKLYINILLYGSSNIRKINIRKINDINYKIITNNEGIQNPLVVTI